VHEERGGEGEEEKEENEHVFIRKCNVENM
jgi:hypothetical protein